MTNLVTDLDKVKKHWGQKAQEDLQLLKSVAWMNHPYIERYYIHQQISHDPAKNWFDYVNNKYIPHQLELGLNLGCGDGGLERHAFRIGMCKRFEAFDVAEGAIKVCMAGAIQQGFEANVKYEVKDINAIQLEANKYDIAFACMSAHHFKALEHVFSEVRKALKPKGFFILYEYVGPSQFQWTDQQLAIINDLLKILPAKYRQYLPYSGQLKEFSRRPSIEEMNSYDPSEAIRSAEIIPLLPQYFQIIERIDYGGTILHMLLQDIAGNFNPNQEDDLTILKLLCYFEETLIKNDVLPSDFTLIVTQKDGQSLPHLANYAHPNKQRRLVSQSHDDIIQQLSGEDIARQIPIRKLIKAVGFKIGQKPGLRWLYRLRGLGKKLVGG